jgi:putative redox protein
MDSGKPEHPVIAEDTGIGRLQVQIQTQGTSFYVDEPVGAGGLASGPSPFDLLSASLGACTVMTIKFYANRKGIPVTHVQVIVSHHRRPDTGRDVFQRSIFIDGAADEGQMRQLLSVADRCPVSKTLNAGADIATIRHANAAITGRRVDDDEHLRAMVAACEASVPGAECPTA